MRIAVADVDSSSMIKSYVRKACVVGLLGLLCGCSTNTNEDLHNRIASIKAQPAGKIPPLPVFAPYETFLYGARDKQDPFKGYESLGVEVEGVAVDVQSPLAGRNLETLEEYPLDTLRYVGQLIKDEQEWAIVTSPDSIVHRVQKGNHLGKNYGEIVEILEDKILIEELIPDEVGGWVKRDAALSLME